MPNPTPDCCFIPLIYNTLSATDPTAFPHPHPHLPTLALPNATFGYSKSSELSRIRYRAAMEPLRESDDDPAVNRKDGAGDVRGHVAGQEEERVGDLISSPTLPIGMRATKGFIMASGRFATMSVRVTPGATALTLIPRGASSRERDFVRPLIANLVVGYRQPDG